MKLTDEFHAKAGVYIIKCLVNGKYYVGETLNIQRRMGEHCIHKLQLIHKAILKHGIENFEVYIEYLPDFDKESLINLETELIEKLDCLVPNGYNLCLGGMGFTGCKHSEESKIKLKNKRRGRTPSLGLKHSESTKKQISISSLERKHTEETKRGISDRLKGNKYSLGAKRSDETKEKTSKALKGNKNATGAIRNENTRKKMSETHKNRMNEKVRLQKSESAKKGWAKRKGLQ